MPGRMRIRAARSILCRPEPPVGRPEYSVEDETVKNHVNDDGHDDLCAKGSGAEETGSGDRRMEPVVVRIRTKVCSVVEAALSANTNWVLDDGGERISVAMEDWRFQERVSRGDVLVDQGDVLVCRVRVVDRQTPTGLVARQDVVEVRDHRVPRRHPDIPTMPAFS